MLDLALNYGNGPVLLREISERQDVSMKYLEQLVTPLRVAGLVKSTRGPHGGYHLTREPSEITLHAIIEILEGPISLTACATDGDSCERSDGCVTREIWEEVTDKIANVLRAVTLQEMCERERATQDTEAGSYQI
jgi:Rrf2 family protein